MIRTRKIIYSTIILIVYTLIAFLCFDTSHTIFTMLFTFPISLFFAVGFSFGENMAYLFLFVCFSLIWLVIYFFISAIMSHKTKMHSKK